MPEKEKADRTYICIDLKSFYASVECVERGLDPLTTDLVVADLTRTEKTVCLAVSPSLKAKGVRNRCRVFEIPKAYSYIAAPPRMKKYIEYSAGIYGIYLKYFSKDDIHVYSIDEAFIDVTDYLPLYHTTAQMLAAKVMHEVWSVYGITATCGIGPNLYLCKIALDITAKHMSPGPRGERIGFLTEESYRKELWDHQPITDFWRVGNGIARRLKELGIVTMGQLAHADPELLYKVFGVDAELMIDHAWGREPVTIADIKRYQPKGSQISLGQVLAEPYDFEKGRLIVKEMADQVALDLFSKGQVTQHLSLVLVYDDDKPPDHGLEHLPYPTSSSRLVMDAFVRIYDRVAVRDHTDLKRVYMGADRQKEDEAVRQMDLFDDPEKEEADDKDRRIQTALMKIKGKYGKNAVLRGMDLQEGATQKERNEQISGHKA